MKPQIIAPSACPKAIGPYHHAIRAGDLLVSSGQIPLDPATGQITGNDIKSQTIRVLENIKLILESQNLGFKNVIKTTVFMTNLADFGAMNEVYGTYFTADYPARSTVQVSALPRAAQIEIEFLAYYAAS